MLVASLMQRYSYPRHNTERNLWTDISNDTDAMKEVVEKGVRLKVVGVVQPTSHANSVPMTQGIAYTPELTRQLMKMAEESDIVKQQKAHPEIDVFTGTSFDELRESQGQDFDLSSMFNVDEQALQNAFSMDMSGLDMSNISIDPNALNIDTSKMNIDSSAISNAIDPKALGNTFSEDAMRKMMSNAPAFDMKSAGLTGDDIDLTEDQQKMINDATDQLSSGFMA